MIQTTNGRFVSCVSLCFPCYAQGAEIHEIFGKGKRFSERAHTSLILGLDDATFTLAEILNCDFRGTQIHSAKFGQSNLSHSVFHRAALVNCDFRDANLSTTDFSNAILADSLFGAANLMAADFRGAVLEGARQLSSSQLTEARTSVHTILPDGSKGPFVRGFGAEHPVRQ